MVSSNVEEIIQFAIEEEKKAAALYEQTAEKVNDKSLSPLLKDLATMEKGHEAKLKGFLKGKVPSIGSTAVQDLKIGDYLVDVEINENSTIQDVLVFSIKAEMKANELYTNLAKLYDNPEEKDLFLNLANEESGHKNELEKAYDDYVYKEN
jgi:rubrerythrin